MTTEEHKENYLNILDEACCGNASANSFCQMWSAYCHMFDDIVDSPKPPDANTMLKCNGMLQRLLVCPFYRQYEASLLPMIMLVGEAYGASEYMKLSSVDKHKQWGLYLRHSGNDMIRLVAAICGGAEILNSVSKRLREASINEHYDTEGNPI